MTRVKSTSIKHRRHKKILKQAKGFRGARSKLVRTANEAIMHAGAYAYAGRKQRKRQKRSDWIVTISAALVNHNLSYNSFIHLLKKNEITLDRKVLSELINKDRSTFDNIVKQVIK